MVVFTPSPIQELVFKHHIHQFFKTNFKINLSQEVIIVFHSYLVSCLRLAKLETLFWRIKNVLKIPGTESFYLLSEKLVALPWFSSVISRFESGYKVHLSCCGQKSTWSWRILSAFKSRDPSRTGRAWTRAKTWSQGYHFFQHFSFLV